MGKFLLPLLVAVACSPVVCQQQKYTITGKILTLHDNGVWEGLSGVKICIQRTSDKVIVGRGMSGADGSYTVEYDKTRTINAIYGNAIYPSQLVPSLSGETNHTLTKVLSKNGGRENGERVKFSTEESHAIISAYESIQSKPESFDPDLRQSALTLDETMFPTDVQTQVAELRLNAIIQERGYKSMVPATFSGIVVGQSSNEFTVRKLEGGEYSVRLLDSALCADLQTDLTKCKEKRNQFGSNLTGRKVEIVAAISTANGIAVADRLRVSRDQ